MGHAATAEFISHLLGVEVPENRVQIHMRPGDCAVVIRLLARLEAGRTFEDAEELAAVPCKLGLLRRIA